MVRTAITAGVTAGVDNLLTEVGKVNTDISSASLGDKFISGFTKGTGNALAESMLYGTSLEEALKIHLSAQLIDATTASVYQHGVKPLDQNTLINNVSHKLAASLTGCLSSKAKDKSCEAGAIGAIIGEMVGDWMVNDEIQAKINSGEIRPGSADYNRILNTAKLTAGTVALLYDFDVNQAVGSAGEAVEWNAIYFNKVKANAPKANQEQANNIAILLSTGNLEFNKENLDYLYQINTDKDLTIEIDANNVGNVILTSDWIKIGDGRSKAVVRPMDLNKWAIFGSLTLVRRHNGSYGFFNDTYDFETHNSLKIDEIMRNANTKLGDPICGSLSGCTGFQIKFTGNYNHSQVYIIPL